jgi:energy-coupling factor transport system ATP-binding protein
VLANEGERLAAGGVWVPRFPPRVDARKRSPGSVRLTATDLAIARSGTGTLREHLGVVLRSGSALAVTGPNGSGKSTLGLTLGGLIPAASGTVDASPLAAGLSSEPIRWKSRDLVSRIGSVFQDPEHQFLAGTVRDELAVGPRVLKLSQEQTAARVEEFAARLRLTGLLAANPFTLSGGEKRRLSVATALITRPPLLVADEPTFGQDSRTWAELVTLFSEFLDGGGSLVAITHDAAFVDAIAHERLVLGLAEGARR